MSPRTQSRGELTKGLILETAIKLFHERGYEETTMRSIAERSGVALGNAYYYFRSKEHLVLAFYQRINALQMEAAKPILELETSLKSRLIGVIRAELAVLEPYHAFWVSLFKSAADPRSPLNPFSPESEPIRNACMNTFRQVLSGSKERMPDDLSSELPRLLWLYHMGVILFWLHDTSPARIRTHRLIDQSSDLIIRLNALINLPGIGPPLRATIKKLMSEFNNIDSIANANQSQANAS